MGVTIGLIRERLLHSSWRSFSRSLAGAFQICSAGVLFVVMTVVPQLCWQQPGTTQRIVLTVLSLGLIVGWILFQTIRQWYLRSFIAEVKAFCAESDDCDRVSRPSSNRFSRAYAQYSHIVFAVVMLILLVVANMKVAGPHTCL